VGAAFAVLILGPFWLAVPHGDVDPSWALVLHHAFAERLQFGSDIVFTYGPYGFLWTDVWHPDTWGWALVLRSGFAVALWGALWEIGKQEAGPRGWVLAVASLLLAAYSWDSVVWLAVAAWWRLEVLDEGRWSTALLLGLAVMALGKFLLFVALVACVTSLGLAKRWRPAAVASGGLAAAWLMAGQRPMGVVGWIESSVDVAAGFAGAMAEVGSRVEIVVYLLGGALLVGIASRDRRWMISVGPLLILLAVVGKHAFTRHDTAHALIGASLLVSLSLLLAPRAVRVFCVVAAVEAAALWAGGVEPLWEPVRQVAERIPGRVETLVGLPTGRSFERAAAARNGLAQTHPIGPVHGTVDIYPHSQTTLLHHDVDYAPRPVFQSFTAYTPTLQARNVAHLRSDGAPDTVLFDIDPLGGEHPASLDSLSLLELLDRYDVSDPLGRFVTLRRRGSARGVRVEAGQLEVAEGWRTLSTPVGEARWLRATGASGPIVVRVRYPGGSEEAWTVPAATARAGFLVAPTVATRLDWAGLLTAWPQRVPVAVQVVGASQIAIDRVVVPGQAGLRLRVPPGRLRELSAPPPPAEEHVTWLAHDRGPRAFAHAPSTLELPVGPGRVEVGFGLLEGAGRGDLGDGVLFSASLRRGQQLDRLWEVHLDPADPLDLAEQRAGFEVPAAGALVLRCEPGESANKDWSYWSDVRTIGSVSTP
jgi:hypothetical protein